MYLYILENSTAGDPWQFMGAFSSQSVAEETLVSAYGHMSSDHLHEYRLFRVDCDDRLWGNQTPLRWSSRVSMSKVSGA